MSNSGRQVGDGATPLAAMSCRQCGQRPPHPASDPMNVLLKWLKKTRSNVALPLRSRRAFGTESTHLNEFDGASPHTAGPSLFVREFPHNFISACPVLFSADPKKQMERSIHTVDATGYRQRKVRCAERRETAVRARSGRSVVPELCSRIRAEQQIPPLEIRQEQLDIRLGCFL